MAIPAANIGNVDLVAIAEKHPVAAKEISRLATLMYRGDETPDEFRRLCELLFEVGATVDSEYLLRRNVSDAVDEALYAELFGTSKREDFDAAVAAFRCQFEIELSLVQEHDFLVCKFRSVGCRRRDDAFRLLSCPCEVEIGFIERDRIEAEIVLDEPGRTVFNQDECLSLNFISGVWEIVEPIDQDCGADGESG